MMCTSVSLLGQNKRRRINGVVDQIFFMPQSKAHCSEGVTSMCGHGDAKVSV